MMMFNLSFLFVLAGVVSFILSRKYLLSMLLSLEFIMLGLFLGLIMLFISEMSESYFLMLFLVFVVCEGALGLSILVSMIRTHGNNYFQSFNILLC